MTDLSTSMPAAAPAAAPAPAAEAPQTSMSWEQIASQAMSGDFTAPPAANSNTSPEAPEAPVDEWEAKRPPERPQISSAAERIAHKRAQRLAAQQQLPLQQQLEAERQRVAQLTESQARAEAEFHRLLEAGDVDAAFKVKGIKQSFMDLQRAMLVKKGALPPPDPRFDALNKELEALKNEKAQAERASKEAAERARAKAEYEADVQAVADEIAGLSLRGADKIARVAGFADSVTKTLVEDGNLTTEQAAALWYSNYKALYEQLHPVFGGGTPQPQQQAPRAPARSVPTTLPVSAGATPAATIPDNLSAAERWEQIVRQAQNLG